MTGLAVARVTYFFSVSPSLVAFLDIYFKTAKEDLTGSDKRDLRAAIAEIRAALRGPAGRYSGNFNTVCST